MISEPFLSRAAVSLNSRREFVFTAVGGVALASAIPTSGFADEGGVRSDAPIASAVPFVEHRISHDGHMIYAREYPGQGPAYVLLHGFPDIISTSTITWYRT
jgi:hypothetical protein